jgi:hypothetical protein
VAIRNFDRFDGGRLCGSSADAASGPADDGSRGTHGDAHTGGTADANARGNRNSYGVADSRTRRHRNDCTDGDAQPFTDGDTGGGGGATRVCRAEWRIRSTFGAQSKEISGARLAHAE